MRSFAQIAIALTFAVVGALVALISVTPPLLMPAAAARVTDPHYQTVV